MMAFWEKWFVKKENELLEYLQDNALLLDVRSLHEFQQGSIENAQNQPLDTLYEFLHLWSKDQKIIVFCRSGNRSSHAKNLLEKNGFQHVVNGKTIENILIAKNSLNNGNSSR